MTNSGGTIPTMYADNLSADLTTRSFSRILSPIFPLTWRSLRGLVATEPLCPQAVKARQAEQL